MRTIMEQIKPENLALFALEFGKIALFTLLVSPDINQPAPSLVKMYVTIRSWMSSIMDLIRADLSELFALEFAKIAESDCLHSNIYKCRPVSTKHGHNIYENEILDKFNYGSNPTVTFGVICS